MCCCCCCCSSVCHCSSMSDSRCWWRASSLKRPAWKEAHTLLRHGCSSPCDCSSMPDSRCWWRASSLKRPAWETACVHSRACATHKSLMSRLDYAAAAAANSMVARLILEAACVKKSTQEVTHKVSATMLQSVRSNERLIEGSWTL
jgi:hypothetical protein